MRKLVSDEYNALDMLIKIFTGNVSGDQETMLFLMYSMAYIGEDISRLDEYYEFGAREAMLTWNEENSLERVGALSGRKKPDR